jgi:membrane-associated protease RseP (regulator of RpoE activity)
MKKLITLTLSLVLTTSAFAQATKNRTIVVRDGKVVSHSDFPELAGHLLGGKRAHLGISLIDLTDDLREHYGASKDAGVLIGAVEEGSPAEKAGVKVGDIVTSVDGKDVESSIDLRRAMSGKKEGDTVRIEVLRGRNRQTLVATVVEREGLRIMTTRELPAIIDAGEWNARMDRLVPNCGDLQGRIKELETRLKDLEKKLQK